MVEESNTWALVLAAGEGSRLRSLTTAESGTIVPKQFCSLYEGPSLLHEALCRARAVTTESRTCVVVAEQHRRWWEGPLWSLAPDNVIVQAENLGTGLGILLPLLHILHLDPQAQLVLLPSDHYVRYEAVLTVALEGALGRIARQAQETVLLGVQPEELDPDLGYVVPGSRDGEGAFRVDRFVEKPSLAMANELIRSGALWNTFIVVSRGCALLDLFRERFPEIVRVMFAAFESDRSSGPEGTAMAELYENLPVIDFSRDILAEQLSQLRVLPVPPCGWSDLGTPKRVSDALRRAPRPAEAPWMRSSMGYLSLAEQHERRSATHGPCAQI